MVQAIDQKVIGGEMDGVSDGSVRNRKSDGRCERWIMERRMLQAIDQKVIGWMVRAIDHSAIE
jgi:hypothetical protein